MAKGKSPPERESKKDKAYDMKKGIKEGSSRDTGMPANRPKAMSMAKGKLQKR